MQYSDIVFLKKASPVRFLGYFLKGTIFIAASIFIGLQLKEHPMGMEQLAGVISNIGRTDAIGLLLLLPLLTIINWLLEAVKWQKLSSRIEKISLWQSVQGVLTGLSLGFVTPHAVGDYAGRIWQLKNDKRLESVGAIMLGRALQFFPTFVIGLFGVLYFFFSANPYTFNMLAIASMLSSLLAGIGLFIYGRHVFLKTLSMRFLQKFRKYFEIMALYSNKEVISLIGLAFGRYIVFAFQFMALLVLLGASENVWLLMAGVTWTFLGKSIIPSFNFLSDLGVREFSALFFFSHFQVDAMPVVVASFTLWCFNLLLPSVVGMVGIGSMKIFRKT